MSQTAVIIHVDGALHQEVYPSLPDHEEIVQICKDFGYTTEDAAYEGDDIDITCEWYEIGSGESGTDDFFSDEEILAKFSHDNCEKEFEAEGYELDAIQQETFTIYYDELTD